MEGGQTSSGHLLLPIGSHKQEESAPSCLPSPPPSAPQRLEATEERDAGQRDCRDVGVLPQLLQGLRHRESNRRMTYTCPLPRTYILVVKQYSCTFMCIVS